MKKGGVCSLQLVVSSLQFVVCSGELAVGSEERGRSWQLAVGSFQWGEGSEANSFYILLYADVFISLLLFDYSCKGKIRAGNACN